jgi:hypothetical protein
MIYYEKKGHWPFLKAKKQAATSDPEEDYVPRPSHFGVMADGEIKNGIDEPVIDPVSPPTLMQELRESQV